MQTIARAFPRFIPLFAFNGQTFDVENAPPPVKTKEQLEKEEKAKNAPPAPTVVALLPGIHVMPEPKVKAEEKKDDKKEEAAPVAEQAAAVVVAPEAPVTETAPPVTEPAPMANALSAREGQFFLTQYDATKRLLPFNEDWVSGGDRFFNLVNSQGYKNLLKPGEVGRTKDNQDRRVLIVGTSYGPIAIYQRYAEGLNTIVYDAPSNFRNAGFFSSDNRLTIEELERFFGAIGSL